MKYQPNYLFTKLSSFINIISVENGCEKNTKFKNIEKTINNTKN